MKFIPFSVDHIFSTLSLDAFQDLYDLFDQNHFITESIIKCIPIIQNNIIMGFIIDKNNKIIYKIDHTNINQFKEKYLALL